MPIVTPNTGHNAHH